MNVPHLIEPVVGWRAWSLELDAQGRLQLGPAGIGIGAWPRRHAMEARCRAEMNYPHPPKRGTHRSPAPDCTCGIYAASNLDQLLPMRPSRVIAMVGTVSMWGRVAEHQLGWRAEFAYPQRLRLVCPFCLHGDGTQISPRYTLAPNGRRGRVSVLCEAHRGEVHSALSLGRGPAAVQSEILSAYAVDLLPREALDGRPSPSTWCNSTASS